MTKAELVAIIKDAPDDAEVYMEFNGILLSLDIAAAWNDHGQWIISFEPPDSVIRQLDDEDE